MGASLSYHGGDGEMASISSRLCWEGINNGVWHLWDDAPGYFPSSHGLVVALAEVHLAHPAQRGNVLFSLGGSTVCPGCFPAIPHGAGAIQFFLGAEELLHPVPDDGTRLLIRQGSLAAHPTLADLVGEKAPKLKYFFLLPGSQKLLEWAAHTSTQAGSKPGCI